MTDHRQVKDISTDKNMNENNLRKSVSSVEECLFSASPRDIVFALSFRPEDVFSVSGESL